jgi:hypothetical protein
MAMVTYVVSSMLGVAFQLETALVLGVGATILISIIPAVLPKTDEHEGAH